MAHFGILTSLNDQIAQWQKSLPEHRSILVRYLARTDRWPCVPTEPLSSST